MSLLCGIHALDATAAIPEAWTRWLAENLQRSSHGTVQVFEVPGSFLAKLDLGAFGDAAWTNDPARGLTAIAGDPVLPDRSLGEGRARDCARLAACDEAELAAELRASRGSFVLARLDVGRRVLALATDRLGGRPLYVTQHGPFLLFASAKRLLCGLPGLELARDTQGLLEAACFGFPLAERTEIAGVASLPGGQLLLARDGWVARTAYWDWARDACASGEAETPELRRRLFEELRRAIELRIGTARGCFATLSSGLDSRCVVSVLGSLGVEAHTLNVSWSGTLDQIVARAFAGAAGTVHHEDVLPDHELGIRIPWRCGSMMRELADRVSALGGRPRQVWGGNDGSISVGYVYVSRASVDALRRGDEGAAAAQFCGELGLALSRRVLSPRVADVARSIPQATVARELASLECEDPGKRLYLFLLLNHQRRLLAGHMEQIDELPIEHVEPFFDPAFLALACQLPADECVGHGLYYRWLAEFPPVVASVPWQAYAGHEPCPLPMPEGVPTQWEIYDRRIGAASRREALAAAGALLRNWGEAGQILSKRRLSVLWALSRWTGLDATLSLRQAVRLGKLVAALHGAPGVPLDGRS